MWLDDVLVAENGGRAESYTEEAGQAVMNRPEITVRIDLQRGDTTAACLYLRFVARVCVD